MPQSIETVVDENESLAIIIRADFNEPGIHFFTPANFSQQLGVMQHPKGKSIAPHEHNPVLREVLNTQEVLLIRKGRLQVNLFNTKQEFVRTVILTDGDAILLCSGGHGFEMLEETSILEIKQGPYSADTDKTHFQR